MNINLNRNAAFAAFTAALTAGFVAALYFEDKKRKAREAEEEKKLIELREKFNDAVEKLKESRDFVSEIREATINNPELDADTAVYAYELLKRNIPSMTEPAEMKDDCVAVLYERVNHFDEILTIISKGDVVRSYISRQKELHEEHLQREKERLDREAKLEAARLKTKRAETLAAEYRANSDKERNLSFKKLETVTNAAVKMVGTVMSNKPVIQAVPNVIETVGTVIDAVKQ